jgi:tRNA 2-thiouridine synthesizing protein A
MSETLELDCRGMLCPLPVIMLAKRFGEVPVGGTIAVLADDPAAATDIPAWCRLRAQEFVAVTDHRYVVRRLS